MYVEWDPSVGLVIRSDHGVVVQKNVRLVVEGVDIMPMDVNFVPEIYRQTYPELDALLGKHRKSPYAK